MASTRAAPTATARAVSRHVVVKAAAAIPEGLTKGDMSRSKRYRSVKVRAVPPWPLGRTRGATANPFAARVAGPPSGVRAGGQR